MIADGRETELIPFMLRPFRCTDTRGRQTGPRQCVYTYVCMHVVGPQWVDTNDIPSYLWEEPSYRTFCLCVCAKERERIYLHSWSRRGLWGIPLLVQLIWKDFLMKFKFFRVYVFHIISAFPEILKKLWKPFSFIFVQLRHMSLNITATFKWFFSGVFSLHLGKKERSQRLKKHL